MTSRSRSRLLNIALLGVGAVVGVTCAQSVPHDDGGGESGGESSPSSIAPTFAASPAFAQATASGATATLADVAERAVPGVVNLSATRRVDVNDQRRQMMQDPMLREFFGPRGPDLPRDREARSLGSGVIVSADGIVLTSAHVVEKADQVEITLEDGREVDGKVVGADARTDLAVVRIQGKVPKLTPLPMGNSTAMRRGDVVLAIGNPFGVGQAVTMGIVSATGRSSLGIVDFEDFIQTDAAINPGNSGGALVNMKGELIGINTAILSGTGGSMGIGFAIPSAMASPIMKSLLQHGRVTRGFLGIAIQDLDRDLAEALDVGEHEGILVGDVTPGSPAEKAGLTRGDIVRSLNGRKVDSSSQFRNEVAALGPDKDVTLEVARDGKTRTVKARTGTLQEEKETAKPGAQPSPAAPDARDQGGPLAGVTASDLTASLRARLKVPPRIRGAVVTEVAPGSPAEEMGLRPGDVIMEMNRQPIASAADLRTKARTATGDSLVALVFREGSTAYLAARD